LIEPMAMHFSFATAHTILFGAGSVAQVAPRAARLGRRALVVTGRSPQRGDALSRQLVQAGVDPVLFSVTGEPEIETVAAGAVLARRERCDLVIGLGGGSALDAAKAIAALAVNTGPIETYLEVIGRGQPLTRIPLPCIAIPTTAGTGSEVTRNAVLKSVAHNVKVSLRGDGMLPVLAVVDPELTLGLPPQITAATGCDALTQLLEAFVSIKANPLTDGLCREGLPRAAAALPRAVAHGDDLAARSDMALASLFSGLALANGGLGAVHGIAGPLGGMIPAPHGAVCARLLPEVMAANVRALTQRAPQSVALNRYRCIAQILTGAPQATVADGVQWVRQRVDQFAIPDLAHWGLTAAAVPELVAHARRASSMKGNPVELTEEELTGIVAGAMGEKGHPI
jgi:alcohol dehydrogenase class IV